MKFLKIYGAVSLAVCLFMVALNVYRFRYQLGVWIRDQFRDWPVWVYRSRRWFRLLWRSIRNRCGEAGGFVFVLIVVALLALGLIATSPA